MATPPISSGPQGKPAATTATGNVTATAAAAAAREAQASVTTLNAYVVSSTLEGAATSGGNAADAPVRTTPGQATQASTSQTTNSNPTVAGQAAASAPTASSTPATTGTAPTAVSAPATASAAPATPGAAPPAASSSAPVVPAAANTGQTTPSSSPATSTLTLLLNARRDIPANGVATALDVPTLAQLARGSVLKMTAQVPGSIPAGSVLQLQVQPGKPPAITAISAPDLLPASVRSFIAEALLRQATPGPLLQSLQDIAVDDSTALPPLIKQLAAQINAQIPTTDQLRQPGGLKQWVERSGLFFEAKLAASESPGTSARSSAKEQEAAETPATLTRLLQRALGRPSASGGDSATQTRPASNAAPANASTASATPAATENTEDAPVANKTTPADSSPTDMKALLLKLEQALRATVNARDEGAGKPLPAGTSGTAQPATPAAGSTQNAPRAASDATPVAISPRTPGTMTAPQSNAEGAPLSTSRPGTDIPSGKVMPGPMLVQAAASTAPAAAPEETAQIPSPGASTTAPASPPGKAAEARAGSIFQTPAPAAQTPSTQTPAPAGESEGNTTETAPLLQPTTRTADSRKASAASLYQQVERHTRPAPGSVQATPPSPADMQTLADLLLPAGMEIPGLGLPLPHRLRGQPARIDDGLDELLGALLKNTKESLQRLQLHQLAHAGTTTREASGGQQNPPLTFDLPVLFNQQIQMFNLRIEEEETSAGEQSRQQKQEKRWSVSLGFDIEGLGPMFCQLHMSARAAQLQFWADHPATLALTREHLPFLSRSLNDLGVAVSEVACHEGMPKQTQTRLSHQLVDIKT